MEVSVSISHFLFEVVLLNYLEAVSPAFEHLKIVGSGAYGIVMQWYDLKQQIFVAKYSNNRQDLMFKKKMTPERLTKIIIEYCLCKLASVLRIGARIYNFGFDLIVYRETT